MKALHIIKVRAAFELATFDEDLTDLQAVAKKFGEIITTLPSAEESSEDKITFDLIVGTEYDEESIKEELAERSIDFTVLRKGTVVSPVRQQPAPEPKQPVLEDPVQIEDISDLEVQEEPKTLRTISQTVRVDITKLDNLMNIVGELVIGKNILTQLVERMRHEYGFNELSMEMIKNARTMERKLSELQSQVLEVRMVRVGQIFDKLHRNIRKLSRELGKDVEFEANGADTELDKLIIEDLADPLMHIIRNCMDHGH